MKRRILTLLCLFILCGCSNEPTNKDVESEVKNILFNVSKSEQIASPNRNKRYYNYYLPPDMGRFHSSLVGEVFKKDNFKLVMNFNTAPFIIDAFYNQQEGSDKKESNIVNLYTEEALTKLLNDGKFIEKKEDELKEKKDSRKMKAKVSTAVYTTKNNTNTIFYKGYYKSGNGINFPYVLKMKQVNDNYYLYLDGSILTFSTLVPKVEVDNMLHSMLHIMKSIRYDENAVIDDFAKKYSTKELKDDYNLNKDFIFGNISDEGYLEELIKESEGIK